MFLQYFVRNCFPLKQLWHPPGVGTHKQKHLAPGNRFQREWGGGTGRNASSDRDNVFIHFKFAIVWL